MLGLWLLPTCQIVIWLPAPFCQCHSDFIDGSVCCCVGPSGYRCLCYSVTVTFVMAGILFFVPKDKIPVVTDWATVLIWMWQKHILSPHWNFCSERPGRASVCPPLQSIKRSLNVNFCCCFFSTHFTLRIRLQYIANNTSLDLKSEPWESRNKYTTWLCQKGPSADDTSPDTTHRQGKFERMVRGQPVD